MRLEQLALEKQTLALHNVRRLHTMYALGVQGKSAAFALSLRVALA